MLKFPCNFCVNLTLNLTIILYSLQLNSENSERIDEEFTMARLYVSKMKTEVKSLSQRCKILELSSSTNAKKLEEDEKELDLCRLTINQVIIISLGLNSPLLFTNRDYM